MLAHIDVLLNIVFIVILVVFGLRPEGIIGGSTHILASTYMVISPARLKAISPLVKALLGDALLTTIHIVGSCLEVVTSAKLVEVRVSLVVSVPDC